MADPVVDLIKEALNIAAQTVNDPPSDAEGFQHDRIILMRQLKLALAHVRYDLKLQPSPSPTHLRNMEHFE